MRHPSSRRAVLKSIARVATTAAGVVLESGGQTPGRAFELTVTVATPDTVRITFQPIENGGTVVVPDDGALVRTTWGAPALRWRPMDGDRRVKCGNLLVDVSAQPLAVRVARKDGHFVQELQFDTGTGRVTFLLGEGPGVWPWAGWSAV